MSEIFKIVKDKKQGFTIVPNQLAFDENISLKSTMLLIIMLALPPTWDLTIKGLAKLKKDGIDSIRTGINELEKAGYISKKRIRNEKGQVQGTEYTVYETLDLNPKLNNNSPDNEENTNFPPKLDFPIQGKIPKTDKIIKPKLDFPIQVETTKFDKPKLGNPILENPTQLNTESTKKRKRQSKDSSITDSIPFPSGFPESPTQKRTETKESFESYRELILENIEYDHLCREFTTYREDLDEIVELMVETVCAKRKTTRIAGSDFPHEVVRSRFLKLDCSHIEFVMECLRNNTTEIRNMKQYLLAVLFNAPTTISNHYTAQVNHDMYAGGW